VVVEINKVKKIVLITGLLLVVVVVANILWDGNISKEPPNSPDNISDKAATPPKNETSSVETQGEADFFAEYRLQRDQNRSRELQLLRELTGSEDQSKTTRDTASMKIIHIMEDIDKEMKAENLVKSQGVEECVVISEAGMSTVVIKGSKSVINEDEIKDLVCPVLKLNKNEICMVFRNKEQ
jgi:stage III sporulation protein AH